MADNKELELLLLEKELRSRQQPAEAPKEVPTPDPSRLSLGGLAHSFTDSLPLAGMIGGGALGAAGGPVTSVAGAGGGYALGKQARDLVNQYAFDQPIKEDLPTRIAGAGKDVVEGAALDAGGGAAARGLLSGASKIGQVLSKATPAVSGAETAASVVTGLPKSSMPENLRLPDVAERPADWFFKTRGSVPQQYASPDLPEIPAGKSSGVMNVMGGVATDAALGHVTHGLATPMMVGKAALQSPVSQQAVQKGLQSAAPALKAADEAFQNVVSIPMKAFNKLSPGYQTVLKQAAEQGGRQLAITHFILGQRDPAYQDALKDK